MESLDILTILIAGIVVLLMFRKKPSGWRHMFLIFSVVIALLHVIIEGPRWQMVPAYFAIVCLIGVAWIHKYWVRVASAIVALPLFIASIAFSWAFPIFELPQPDGIYGVGTTEAILVDDTRAEAYTTDPADVRRLMVRIWYPTTAEPATKPAMYWEDAVTRSRAVTSFVPLPWFTFSHLGNVKTFSQLGVPVADGAFPVVIYSHGLGVGWSSANTPMVERLASHGYIVVGIDHPFIGSAAIFPDNVVVFDKATGIALNTEPPANVKEIYDKVLHAANPEEQLDLYMQAMALMPVSIKGKVDVGLHTQVADQKFVLDSLSELNSPNIDLASHLDHSRVGLVGMSLGGSAAIITCAAHPGCSAVINMDGFHPDQAHVSLAVPSMSMHRPDNLLVHANFVNSNSDAYMLRVMDTTHFNFFDFSIMSPLYKRMGVLGSIDGYKMVDITGRYSLAFFNQFLKGEASALLVPNAQSEFHEVTLERRSPLSE